MSYFKESTEKRKTSFLKESVENADLNKAILNKTLTTQEYCKIRFCSSFKNMLKRNLKQKLALSVKSFCFLFNDVYYKQIDGVAMGSPVGPLLANLLLVCYEYKLLENCPLRFQSKYYRRYVDGIFLMF